MKKIALCLTLLCAALPRIFADEVALLNFRVGKEKTLRPVAIEFFDGDAPGHSESFKKLAKKGFYNGLSIHRMFPNTLVQMGDPLTRGGFFDKDGERSKVGTGGPGFTIPAEIRRKHLRGSIAAARLPDKINPSRHSNGSQFYVCLQPMPALDGQYTVFGNVIYGMDTLETLSARSVDTNDNPLERIEIASVKVMPREALPPAPKPAAAVLAVQKKPWWKILR